MLVAGGLGGFPEGIHHWRATYVEALVAHDRVEDAAAAASDLAGSVGLGADVSVAADAARAAGLVAAAQGRREAAAQAFAGGLGLDVRATRPYERGCLELAAGANLRRMGNRREAAALLESAARRFDDLGAAPRAARSARGSSRRAA